jgi:eukaryotic-like serine/threonine-protein kinase
LIVGTVGYITPEQARGESAAAPEADVFAFGVLLYELVTGKTLDFVYADALLRTL